MRFEQILRFFKTQRCEQGKKSAAFPTGVYFAVNEQGKTQA